MSLYRWFAPDKQPTKPYLPDPSKQESEKDAMDSDLIISGFEKAENKDFIVNT